MTWFSKVGVHLRRRRTETRAKHPPWPPWLASPAGCVKIWPKLKPFFPPLFLSALFSPLPRQTSRFLCRTTRLTRGKRKGD